MQIKYSGDTIQHCPECHHTSVYFFDDLIMCILCGWERKRSENSRPCAISRSKVLLELPMRTVPRLSKRARKRARKAALAAKQAEG